MSLRSNILEKLTASRNAAAERALALVIADAPVPEQVELADVLLERNRRGGWVMLIRAYHRLDESIKQKVLARPRDLFGPLAETMQDPDGPARENVIAIVKACADARLVYLLAEALTDGRPEVRDLAGQSLLETIRLCRDRGNAAAGEGGAGAGLERVVNPDDASQIARAIDFALHRYKSHRQVPVLHAALMNERQIDSPLWPLFHDPYDDLTRAATVTLRAPADPPLVSALFLALASPLKAAAMAGIASLETGPLAGAAAVQSYRLIDPVLRDAVRGVSHLKLLPALRKDPPWTLGNWNMWLRLIETVGLQVQDKLNWLVRVFEAAAAGAEHAAWKICALRAIAETLLPEAATTLANAVRDADERVARCAGRWLLQSKVLEWREIAAGALVKSPHQSVRRMAANLGKPLPSASAARSVKSAAGAQPTFDKQWNDYQKMPPVVQHNTARSVATDPAYAKQLHGKLQSGAPQELAQGLRMLAALPSLADYRNPLIALCGHGDPRIAAMAVRLVGRLDDPRLKELLEAAMLHADPRVRANAIESMEELHVSDRSQFILNMLNSRHQRERANAIKAIGQFNFATSRECLAKMLSDANPLHRMSALWVVGQLNFLDIMRQVSLIARRDPNMRVRKRAGEMLETLSGNIPAAT